MSDNLDAPTGSSVDVTEPPQVLEGPPWQVVMAIRLAAANYGLGLVMIFVFWDYFSTIQSAGSVIFNQVFSLALAVWIYYKIYVGRNWARVTMLVLIVLVGLMTLSSVFREKFMELTAAAPALVKVHMFLAPALSLVILWLLFVSPGRHWFRRVSTVPVA